MSRQPKRHAHLEIVEADVADYICTHGHIHGEGHWCDDLREHPARWRTPKSKRPHFIRIVAANGQTLAHTENYANLTNARRAVKGLVRAFAQVYFAKDDGRPQVIEVAS